MRMFTALTASLTLLAPTMALAHDGVHISDAYARIVPGAKSGAIYLMIENHETSDEHLLSVTTDAATMAEVHQSKVDAAGMASMTTVEGGLVIPAQTSVELQPGGTHIMLMGMTRKLKTGDVVSVTLTFGHAGVETLQVPVNPDQ